MTGGGNPEERIAFPVCRSFGSGSCDRLCQTSGNKLNSFVSIAVLKFRIHDNPAAHNILITLPLARPTSGQREKVLSDTSANSPIVQGWDCTIGRNEILGAQFVNHMQEVDAASRPSGATSPIGGH
jgi:hypothetical protein